MEKNISIKFISNISENPDLIEDIIVFDRLTMEPVLKAQNIEFPLEKRMSGLLHPTTRIICAFDKKILAGYVEFCRDFNDKKNIYITSLQIMPEYRKTALFQQLLLKTIDFLSGETFEKITTNVHKTNIEAQNIYKKLGFTLIEKPENINTYSGYMDKNEFAKMADKLSKNKRSS